MMNSFRLRLLVWTLLISGAVMLVFGLGSSIGYERLKLSELDRQLAGFVDRPTPPPEHFRYWDRFGGVAIREMERDLGTSAVVVVYQGEAPRFPLEEADRSVRAWGPWDLVFDASSALPEVKGELPDASVFPELPPAEPRRGEGRERGGRFGGPDRFGLAELARPTVELMDLEPLGGESAWRFALARFEGYNVLLGADREPVLADVREMRNTLGIAFPLALLVLAVSLWLFANRAISPLRELTVAARQVSAQRLDGRLDARGRDREFAELIEVFNSMLERLEKSFSQATRFSADAAHELKTPLAILQGQLEVALQTAADGSEQQRLLAGLLEEVERLKQISRKLLMLARADAGSLPLSRTEVDLAAMLEECIDALGTERDVFDVDCSVEGSVRVNCDESLTRQILLNLLGNAIKYRHPNDSRVKVTLSVAGNEVRLLVANRCEAIAEEERGRFFDRFVRGDSSRNRRTEGAGLGLSLAMEYARAHGGDLSVAPFEREDRIGFQLRLPAKRSDGAE